MVSPPDLAALFGTPTIVGAGLPTPTSTATPASAVTPTIPPATPSTELSQARDIAYSKETQELMKSIADDNAELCALPRDYIPKQRQDYQKVLDLMRRSIAKFEASAINIVYNTKPTNASSTKTIIVFPDKHYDAHNGERAKAAEIGNIQSMFLRTAIAEGFTFNDLVLESYGNIPYTELTQLYPNSGESFLPRALAANIIPATTFSHAGEDPVNAIRSGVLFLFTRLVELANQDSSNDDIVKDFLMQYFTKQLAFVINSFKNQDLGYSLISSLLNDLSKTTKIKLDWKAEFCSSFNFTQPDHTTKTISIKFPPIAQSITQSHFDCLSILNKRMMAYRDESYARKIKQLEGTNLLCVGCHHVIPIAQLIELQGINVIVLNPMGLFKKQT